MRVCYFGIYKPTYTRNKINRDGLRQNGVDVIECNTRETSWKKYSLLTNCAWKNRALYDVLVVGFPGHSVMPLAWLLGKILRKPVVFDAFVSMYDSVILDRREYSRRSPQALKYWLIDWLACQLADLILLDADAHIEYFVNTFKIRRSKFRRLMVGCDESIMRPQPPGEPHADFLVHFHGTYIPTQGIPYIVRAAKLLEPKGIRFNLIGRLQTYGEAIELARTLDAKNISFIDFLPYEKLAEYMAQADVCLGMFGETDKAKRAGAFKITEALAMAKPVVTADEAATRELLTDNVDCLLCHTADPEDLAEKIVQLRDNPELRSRIAKTGHQVFLDHLTTKALGATLAAYCQEVTR